MVDTEELTQVESQEEVNAVEEQVEEIAEPTPEEKAKLEELESQKTVLNSDAEKHKQKRDELNAQTKEWKAKRDTLNAQVRELVEEAGKARETRDQYNQKVRDAKVVRDEWNTKVSEIRAKINELRPEKAEKVEGEQSLGQMKKELERLESLQQTTVLSSDKEKALVKSISELAKNIREKEKTEEGDEAVKDLVAQLREAKAKAEDAHKAVAECAEQAQSAHDNMLGLYQKADAIRKEADAAQAKFVECKQAADEEHRLHIEQIKSVHEISKSADGIKNKKTAAKKKRADAASKQEAKEIFDKFKAGEKLSTEDLMLLQKSGYL
ncbi:MAG: phosphoserine phosphatase [archaeon]|nr:phosphoserine phosphatase [archaeon]